MPPQLMRGRSEPGRQQPRPARRAKARVACAASLLRWIYSMVVHGTSWDAAVASGAACRPEAA